MRCSIFASLMVVILGISPVGAQTAAEDQAALKAVTAEWMRAYQAGDLDALRALYAEDAIIMSAHKPAARGVGEIVEYFRAGAGSYDLDMIDQVEEIMIHGDWNNISSPV